MKHNSIYAYTVLFVLALLHSGPAISGCDYYGMVIYSCDDEAREKERYEHSTCASRPEECGLVKYQNKGAYTVESVRLNARGSNAQLANAHPDCTDVDKKFGQDLTNPQYHKFLVPAPCAYKLTVKIKSGERKEKNLTLQPECVITAKTKGTTLNDNRIQANTQCN